MLGYWSYATHKKTFFLSKKKHEKHESQSVKKPYTSIPKFVKKNSKH
jgi:hypothetical protein